MRQVLLGILSVIAARPAINQGSVGRLLGIQRANMVSLVTELVERGLVRRELSIDDRRAFALTLTGEGEALLADCLDRIHRQEAAMLEGFSNAERATLLALLSRIEAQEQPL